VPVSSLLLRANYSEGFRAPALTEYQVAPSSFNSTLLDPRRGNVSTTNVLTLRGSNLGIKPETSTTEFYGAVYQPAFAKGLDLSVNYYRTTQRDVIQVISAQTLVNNEVAFPSRIVRAAPDAADTAAGFPGRLTSVDTTLLNFGNVVNHSVDFIGEYVVPSKRFGRWKLRFNAAHTLKTLRETRPGLPVIDDGGDTYGTPDWRGSAAVFWSGKSWNASVFARYLSAFKSNLAGNALSALAIPSQKSFDVQTGYTFGKGIIRGYGKDLRLQVSIGNLFDEQPPFADTVFGFNGALHSPLGRTYQLSFIQPF
jgi:iron complex outermembrane receptor protein